MKAFIVASVILSVITFGCQPKDRINISKDFLISVSLRHSFATPMNLHVKKTGDTTIAIAEIMGGYDDSMPPISSDTAYLSTKEVAQFINLFNTTPIFSLNSDSTMGGEYTDGGTTYFTVAQGNKNNKFEVDDWVTLEGGTKYDDLIKASFYVLNTKFPEFENSIEQNQMYYAHGLPVKVRGQNPKQIRLYGRYFDNDSIQLASLLNQFDKSEPLLLDISNIQTVANIEQLLLDFEHTHTRMAWIIRPFKSDDGFQLRVLRKYNFDTTKMFLDTAEAKAYLLEGKDD